MCAGLDTERLPKTISDAIEVAYHLGFTYLWVDALCIIQDSAEDKARELPFMADIYKGASLTILAASAAAAGEGFLGTPANPPRFLVEPFDINIETPGEDPFSITFGYRAPYMASSDPISSRAWTLQERVLSPRLLIFSQSGVMWMCQERYINPGAAPDAGPPYQTSLISSIPSEDHNSKDDTTKEETTREGISKETLLLESWTAIRADYIEMDLTYPSDKLIAISAVAAEVSMKTGWRYLAGMWEHNLFSELHWRCTKRGPGGEVLRIKPEKVRRAGYLAPSWSWASVGLGAILDSEDDKVEREVFRFSIVKCHVDVDPDFPFGSVKVGYLEVEGMVLELPWRSEELEWDGSDVVLLDPEEENSVGGSLGVGIGYLDPLDDCLDPSVKLVCLGMSKLRLGRQRIVPVEGLLLLPVESGGPTFRRVGFFRMTTPSVFDEAHTKSLTIE